MQTHHTHLTFHGLSLHRIDFSSATFADSDLLGLPHYAKLLTAGRKRKAEHLAGRMAAFHALREQGIPFIPDIGEKGQPQWPAGWYGSISHSADAALAVVARQRVGIDIETRLEANLCEEVADSIAGPDELMRLRDSRLPFPLALTLAFSAKESLYKALSDRFRDIPGFHAAQVSAITPHSLTLELRVDLFPSPAGTEFTLYWRSENNHVITLLMAGE